MAKLTLEANHLIKLLTKTTRFEKCMKTLNIDHLSQGKCIATLKVLEEHTNPLGTLHGGLSASLVDSISSWALLTHDNGNCPSVSININMTYLKGAMEGEEIQIEAETTKVGKTLAFLEVFIKNKNNGTVLVKGEHIKFLMRS